MGCKGGKCDLLKIANIICKSLTAEEMEEGKNPVCNLLHNSVLQSSD